MGSGDLTYAINLGGKFLYLGQAILLAQHLVCYNLHIFIVQINEVQCDISIHAYIIYYLLKISQCLLSSTLIEKALLDKSQLFKPNYEF